MAALPFILRFYGNELKKTLETESTNCVVFFFSHFGFLRQVFSVVLFFCFLYSPGHPGTHSVDKASLKFTEISLPLPSKYVGEGVRHYLRTIFKYF